MALKPVSEMTDAEIDAEVRALAGLSADPTRDPSWQGSRSEEKKARETAMATFNASGGQQRIDELRSEVASNPARSALNTQWQAEQQQNEEDWQGQIKGTVGALAGMTLGAGLAGGFSGAGAAAGGAGTATGGGLTAGQAAGTAAMAPGYVAPAIATPTVEALAGTAAAGGLTGGAGALAPAAGKIIGGSTGTTGLDPNTLASLIQGGTALVAGEIGAGAAEDATAEMRRQFDIGQQNIQPFREAQLDLLGLGKGGPEAQLASLMASPGYQFRLQQGQKGLEASSAARGGMGSGKALTAATQYGQEYASGEYGNRLNQLSGGQTQARQDLQSGMNYAGEIGSAGLVGSQMRQSGLLGAGQAASNILNPPRTNTLSDLGAYSREQEVLGAAKPKLSNLFSTGGGYRAY